MCWATSHRRTCSPVEFFAVVLMTPRRSTSNARKKIKESFSWNFAQPQKNSKDEIMTQTVSKPQSWTHGTGYNWHVWEWACKSRRCMLLRQCMHLIASNSQPLDLCSPSSLSRPFHPHFSELGQRTIWCWMSLWSGKLTGGAKMWTWVRQTGHCTIPLGLNVWRRFPCQQLWQNVCPCWQGVTGSLNTFRQLSWGCFCTIVQNKLKELTNIAQVAGARSCGLKNISDSNPASSISLWFAFFAVFCGVQDEAWRKVHENTTKCIPTHRTIYVCMTSQESMLFKKFLFDSLVAENSQQLSWSQLEPFATKVIIFQFCRCCLGKLLVSPQRRCVCGSKPIHKIPERFPSSRPNFRMLRHLGFVSVQVRASQRNFFLSWENVDFEQCIVSNSQQKTSKSITLSWVLSRKISHQNAACALAFVRYKMYLVRMFP